MQYRIQGVTAWTTWPHTVTSSPVTIDNLRNEATYDVQVRARYNANNAGCGTAAKTSDTPSAGVTDPASTTTTTPITPVDAACPTTSTATTSGPPQNLDVRPLSQRRVVLCWTPVSNASRYQVEVTTQPTATSRTWKEAAAWGGALAVVPPPDETKLVIDLDDVLYEPSMQGLADNPSIGLRIELSPNDSTGIQYSEMVVLVDSPIVAASVFKSNPQEANIRWLSSQSVLHDDNYADGTNDLRYRVMHGNYSERS